MRDSTTISFINQLLISVRSEVIAIMKETAPGKSLARAGVRGRLGDLGTIDMKYDVAIR
jgi:hypothetical protein